MKPFYTLLNIASVGLAGIYLLSCLTGYFNPAVFWPFTFLALGFPILAALMIVFSLAWLFFDQRRSLLFFLLIFAGYNNLSNVFAAHPLQSFSQKKDSLALRVISWNVRSFENNAKHAEHPDSTRRRMINYLIEQNADVLLLQEYVEYHNENIYSNNQVLSDTLGYKYFYTSKDLILQRSYGPVEYGCAIFSKYPLLDTIKMNYNGLAVPESAISASILFNHRKLRLFTTHLVSMNLANSPSDRQDEAFKRYDSAFIYGSSKYTKLRYYDKLHSRQAIQLKKFTSRLKEPAIISGDFNSVPSSFAYNAVKGKLQDAFLKSGFGFGRSYTGISPTLRIDYILADKSFEVLQCVCPRLYLSDHFPVVADFKWQ